LQHTAQNGQSSGGLARSEPPQAVQKWTSQRKPFLQPGLSGLDIAECRGIKTSTVLCLPAQAPLAVKSHIFSFLDAQTLCALADTSALMHTSTDGRNLWTSLINRDFPEHSKLGAYAAHCGSCDMWALHQSDACDRIHHITDIPNLDKSDPKRAYHVIRKHIIAEQERVRRNQEQAARHARRRRCYRYVIVGCGAMM